MSYLQDYDERMLTGRYPGVCLYGHNHQEAAPNAINDYRSWQVHLQPYIKNTQMFECPSEVAGKCTSAAGNAFTNLAYGFNYDGAFGRSLATIDQPAAQMLHCDMQDTFVISSTNTYATFISQIDHHLENLTYKLRIKSGCRLIKKKHFRFHG